MKELFDQTIHCKGLRFETKRRFLLFVNKNPFFFNRCMHRVVTIHRNHIY